MITTPFIRGYDLIFESSDLLCIRHENGVFTIVLNSPANLNALGPEMARNARNLSKLLDKHNPRVIVLRGAGKAFSAGGDLEYLLSLTKKDQDDVVAEMYHFYQSFLNLVLRNCPSIAFINGHAVGAGCCIALACDMRYVVRSAKLGMNFVKIGLNPGMAAEYFVMKKLPSAIAYEMLTTGRIYSAEQLDKFHLFNYLGDAEDAEREAYETAAQIAANRALSISKSIPLARDYSLSLDEILVREAMGQGRCLTQGEVAEAVAAQKDKKPYTFKS